jgi:hypothetical protein
MVTRGLIGFLINTSINDFKDFGLFELKQSVPAWVVTKTPRNCRWIGIQLPENENFIIRVK